jgi:capsular exopolysaccharide synthesis family protein
MTVREYLHILRRRWQLVVGCLGVVFAITLAVNFTLLPKAYTGSAKLLVTGGKTAVPGGPAVAVGPQRVQSYAALADSLDVATAAVREENLNFSPETLQSRISASVPTSSQLVDLKVSDPTASGAQRATNAVAAALARKIRELERSASGRQPAIVGEIAEHSGLPDSPSSPATIRNLVFGFFLAIALGIAAAITREIFDTRVRGAGMLTEKFGLVTLGVIEKDHAVEKHPLMVQAAPKSSMAESFRQLRTNLRFVHGQRSHLAVVVTSAEPNEGKSTIASNLGIALAMAGESVVLVEGDFRRPRLGAYLGLSTTTHGLSDVLIGDAKASQVLWTRREMQLKLLLEGRIPPNPSELLGSQAMADLLTELKSQANIVLIDTPPVLAFSDAAVTAAFADTALLVVRAGSTRLESVDRALIALDTVGASVSGLVLSMAPTRGPDADYTYDGYRSYYSDAPGEIPSAVSGGDIAVPKA